MRMNASQAHTATGVSRATIGRWIKAGKLEADEDGYFAEEDFKVLNAQRITKPGPGRKTGRTVVPKKKQPVKKKPVTPAVPKKKPPPTTKQSGKKTGRTVVPKKKQPAPARLTEDDQLNQAREFCRVADNYSISFVQRKLSVGFNKAQRITTMLQREKEQLQAFDALAPPNEMELRIAKNARSRQGVDLRKALANAEKAEMEVKIKMKDLISRELASRVFRKVYAIDSTEWRGLGPRIAPDIMAICEVEDPTKEVEISDLVERQVFRTLGQVQRAINAFLEEVESDERIGDGQ